MTSDDIDVQKLRSTAVLQRLERGMLWLTLEGVGRANALDRDAQLALVDRLDYASRSPEVHAVVITGAGDVFSGGGDLKRFDRPQTAMQMFWDRESSVRLFEALRRVEKLTVASVNGPCVGGAVGLALSCDLVFMADDAFFRLPEFRAGFWPALITPILLRHIPSLKLVELIASGRKVLADEADRLNMASVIVQSRQLAFRVQEYLEDLTAGGVRTEAIALGRLLMRESGTGSSGVATRAVLSLLAARTTSDSDGGERERTRGGRRSPRFA